MHSKQLIHKAIVIAEAGVNHNGSLADAKKLVLAAKNSGANYIKFQYFKSKNLVNELCDTTKYQKENDPNIKKQQKLLKGLELSKKDFIELKNFSNNKNIKFLCSVFNESDLSFVDKISDDFIKIPSGEFTNLFMLRKIKYVKNKIILSTGTCTLKEIKKIINILINNFNVKKNKIILMHCISSYPTNLEKINLSFLETIKKLDLNNLIGFSDHSKSIVSGSLSYAMGARIIEKHITLNNKSKGPDHSASLNPKNFKKYVEYIREAELIIGENKKKLSLDEKANKKLIQKYIVAKKNIKIGEKLTFKNLKSIRTGKGIRAFDIFSLINKKAKKKFNLNELIII
jgi:N,N'-diacetyllegionaminate synthase